MSGQLQGGPADGVILGAEAGPMTVEVAVEHVNCGCSACAAVEGPVVAHVYRRVAGGMFAFDHSEAVTS